MIIQIILIIYLCMIPVSWLLISGWVYAKDSKETIYASNRYHSGFSTIWSLAASVFWPVYLPGVYCITGYAEHGWKPVWKLD